MLFDHKRAIMGAKDSNGAQPYDGDSVQAIKGLKA